MKPVEPSLKTPRTQTGAFAMLRALPVKLVLALTVVGMLLLAPSSLGASSGGPPRFDEIENEEVFSTRVRMRLRFDPESLATKWAIEYGTAPTGPWTLVNSGEEGQSEAEGSHVENIEIGAQDAVENDGREFLRKLKPDTSYYVHFVLENKDGEAKNKNGEPGETVPFTTLPIRKPNVDFIEPLDESTDSTAGFKAKIEDEGAQTTYSFEYAPAEAGGSRPAEGSASWKQFTSGAVGTITAAEEYAGIEAHLTKLKPESIYYIRLKASNEKGETIQTSYGYNSSEFFTTLTAKPRGSFGIRNITADSAFLDVDVLPYGSETESRLEYASSKEGPWSPVPGGTGMISQGQAEATPYDYGVNGLGARLTGLKPSTTYYARLFTTNRCAEGCGSTTSAIESFETSGAPKATTFAAHWLVGESLRLLGAVNPDSLTTSAEQAVTVEGAPTGGTFTLTFNGHTTGPIAYDASAQVVQAALGQIGSESTLVEGLDGGPYTVYFGYAHPGMSEPLIEANGSGLTPSGAVSVATTQQGGFGYDTHYRFQYVSQKSFTEHGWANPEETASMDLGSGDTTENISDVLPALTPGETYRYRVVAVNTAPGTSPVEGAEQTLVVPVRPSAGGSGGCPNEVFRTGLSAHLPDCRAYEQLTPVDKEGAEEPFHYSGGIETAVLVGEDGEHAVLEASPVSYGLGSGSGQSPYLFSRREGAGWMMTAGAPTLETGIDSVNPQVYSANLTQIAFETAYAPSTFSESPDVEYKVGPVGGPYTTAASVPHKDEQEALSLGEGYGWVAANGGLSKLVFATRDHTLVGEESTGTKSGSDLYEYTPGGGLRQLNVIETGGETVTIGSCGARVAHGEEEGALYHVTSGPHSVSADGSRIFFEAVPGKNCSEPSDLYMRMNGAETVDIGAYKFLGANAEGTRLLLESGGEMMGYNTETKTVEHQSGGEVASAGELDRLGIPVRTEPQGTDPLFHPRFTYWEPPSGEPGQVYRYDSVEHLIECISCASSFDPDPKQPAFFDGVEGIPDINAGLPDYTTVSGNGEFAFFTTPAALVPQDVDGEIPIENELHGGPNPEYFNVGKTTSPSSDIYEWRAAGVDGCGQVQGCLALITDGRGGYLNLLLGTADEGRDVFFYTRSVLSPADHEPEGSIGEGNIYDARVDGGQAPPPPRPVECEGDACSTPPSAPNDPTPSSLTFTGNGNIAQSSPAKPAAKSKKPKPKKKATKKRTRKQGKRGARKAVSKSKAHRGGM
jgi:hypothetical protein